MFLNAEVGQQFFMNRDSAPMVDGRVGFARVLMEVTKVGPNTIDYRVLEVVCKTDYGFPRELVGQVGGFTRHADDRLLARLALADANPQRYAPDWLKAAMGKKD
jgi:hypothetical protein